MKESKLIEMQHRIAKIGEVLNEILRKLQQVDVMAKGTLTAFQLHIGEDKWKELVNDLQAIDQQGPKPEEKKFETDVE
jgi:hypothetical protein|tara:strand:- start:25 stop:258 length:234 start_codon:yes stop_codon:yes gene_type:complete